MRINELILEQEQLDELSLAGIGRGIGAAAGAVGRGVGNVQGAWQGAKAAFTQGKAGAADKAARNVAHGGGAAMDKTGAPATAPSTAPATTPAAPASGGNVPGGEVASNNLLARAQQGTTQDPNATQPAAPQYTDAEREAHKAAGGKYDMKTGQMIPPTAPAGGETPPAPGAAPDPAAPAAPAAEPAPAEPEAPAAPVGMKADEIVKGLSDVWGKATASQDSQTSSPKVQQQIRAMGKQAAMAGQTIAESKRVGFRSNFLGMDI
jgi:hypothetical protein